MDLMEQVGKKLWNVNFLDFFKWSAQESYTNETPDYLKREKEQEWTLLQSDFVRFWGNLDQDRKISFREWIYSK